MTDTRYTLSVTEKIGYGFGDLASKRGLPKTAGEKPGRWLERNSTGIKASGPLAGHESRACRSGRGGVGHDRTSHQCI